MSFLNLKINYQKNNSNQRKQKKILMIWTQKKALQRQYRKTNLYKKKRKLFFKGKELVKGFKLWALFQSNKFLLIIKRWKNKNLRSNLIQKMKVFFQITMMTNLKMKICIKNQKGKILEIIFQQNQNNQKKTGYSKGLFLKKLNLIKTKKILLVLFRKKKTDCKENLKKKRIFWIQRNFLKVKLQIQKEKIIK